MTVRSKLPARNLNSAERALLRFATTGRVLDLRSSGTKTGNQGNPPGQTAETNVRANFLAALLTGDFPIGNMTVKSVKLRGAHIVGKLDLEARKLLCACSLQDCCFDESINLVEAETSSIRLSASRVPGINAEQLRTTGNVELMDRFTACGEVRLLGAHITGQFDCTGAQLLNPNGTALYADGLNVDQDMQCRNGFTADGEIRIIGAHIGGDLDFTEAHLRNNGGPALNADRTTVDQHMFCDDRFTARGEIRLLGAHIAGRLSFERAELDGGKAPALNADGLRVDQDLSCRDGFSAHGEIRLVRACIGGELDLSGATLTCHKGPALSAYGLTVGQDLFVRNGFSAHGDINLKNAKAEILYDDQGCWPPVVYLRGFTYDGFDDLAVNVRARLAWLRRNPGRFTPQIYDQLADVYRRAGNEGAAQTVLVTKQWRRRKPYNPLSWLWYITVGYGYRTWQAFIWAAALTVVGSLVFSSAFSGHMAALRAHPPRFQSVVYTLDVLLPIGGLGQKTAWQPTGGYLDWYWAFAIAGWVLAIAVAAGLTGILKRD